MSMLPRYLHVNTKSDDDDDDDDDEQAEQFKMCAQRRPAHLGSMTSIRCPHEEILHSWLFKMQPMKILIRLCECAG